MLKRRDMGEQLFHAYRIDNSLRIGFLLGYPATVQHKIRNFDHTIMALPIFPYPFEEFRNHIKASKQFEDYEHVTIRGEMRDIGSKQTHGGHCFRVFEYMKDTYPDKGEAMYKGDIYIRILDYISEHQTRFRWSWHGLLKRSDKQRRALISEDLYRAVHFIFTDPDYRDAGDKVKPGIVVSLSVSFRKLRLAVNRDLI